MTPSRFMRTRYVVRGTLLVLAVVFAARVGFPFLVQTDAVGGAIEESLEAWTGADLEIGQEPSFAFWPYPRVTLGNVRVLADDPDGTGAAELARIETISATFDLIGAIRGEPAFSDFELVRPVIHVGWNEAGALNWRRSGWLTQAIDAIAAAPEGQAPELRHERIGSVSVEDGRILVHRDGEEPYRISDINGTVNWPVIRRRLEASLSGVMNGELTQWNFACDQPLALFAGRNANVRTNLSADPTTMSFSGVANLSNNAFVSGDLVLSTPSLGHLLSWQGKEIPAVDNIGRLNVEAKVTTAGYAAKLENLKLGLENAQATGVLDVSMPPEGVPQVGGTLAFDHIDLRAFLTAFSPLPDGEDGEAAGIDTAFMHQFGLDLRLSAKTADFAPFSLSDLAAGIKIENGRASFDIGDSAFMDGRLNGRVALTEQGLQGGAQLRLSLGDVEIGALVDTLKLRGPLPVGRGSADFELSTDLPLWVTRASDLSGRFRLRMGPGRLTQFNRQAFEELAARNTFFNISQAANGAFEFVRADIEAKLDRGLAELTKAVIEGNEKTLSLSGMIPYRTGSVALAGTLADRAQQDATVVHPSVSFFVGGSWPEPVISPISVLTGQPGQ